MNESLAMNFMNSLCSDELKNSELVFNDDPDRDRWSTLYDKLDKIVNHKEVEFEPRLWKLLHEYRDRFAVDDAEFAILRCKIAIREKRLLLIEKNLVQDHGKKAGSL